MAVHGFKSQRPVLTKQLVNPALVEHARQRAESVQNRIADRITTFAGSMRFVYLHALWFGCWIGLGVESYPYGLLTMIVSLEAIFLSTFVMISQNRADASRASRDGGRPAKRGRSTLFQHVRFQGPLKDRWAGPTTSSPRSPIQSPVRARPQSSFGSVRVPASAIRGFPRRGGNTLILHRRYASDCGYQCNCEADGEDERGASVPQSHLPSRCRIRRESVWLDRCYRAALVGRASHLRVQVRVLSWLRRPDDQQEDE